MPIFGLTLNRILVMHTDALLTAEHNLLLPAELSIEKIFQALTTIHQSQVDYADVYLQATQTESWQLEDQIIKNGSFHVSRGMGIRAIQGEKIGFAYVDNIQPVLLDRAVMAARGIALSGSNQRYAMPAKRALPVKALLYPGCDPLLSLATAEKISLLQQIDVAARRQDARVIQVMASLAGSSDIVLVAASDGTLAADLRPLVRLNVTVIVEQNGRRESASVGGGGRFGYEGFSMDNAAKAIGYALEAVRQALVALEAVPAPVGPMPVVLGPGWPGILLHEAIGHGLEGDFNRKGTSAFSQRLGQPVASPLCTIVDAGDLASRRGSLNIDDEGTPTQTTVLIENGILKNYLQDRHNARLMGMQSTGNGRRESYAHAPMPRMTNTYMLPGVDAPEDIIASVERGIYAVNFSGGQVDITSGKFVFAASEAYLIENGKITRPVKGAMLIGNGPDVLTRVSMVGNDLQLDAGVGVCGKDGQSVPVGVGQPTVKIDSLTVGGTHTPTE